MDNVTSFDGVINKLRLTIPTTPSHGKKMNQKKRSRTNRTTTGVYYKYFSGFFTQTPAATTDKLVQMVNRDHVQDVQNKLIADENLKAAPQNSNIIRNKKTKHRCADKITNGCTFCATLADEYQIVFGLLKTDPLHQVVIGQHAVECSGFISTIVFVNILLPHLYFSFLACSFTWLIP